MTPNKPSHSVTSVLAVLAIAITAICWNTWGAERGTAAGIGGALSVLNWMSLRWLVARVMASTAGVRAALSLLLVAKMGALMAVLFVLLNRFAVEPLGLMLGLSVLFVGPVLGALLLGNQPMHDPATAGSAGEEH